MRYLQSLLVLAALLFAPLASADPVYQSQTIACTRAAIYDASTNGSTKLVTGTATGQIYVCGWNIFAAGTGNVKLVYGSGTNCVTSPAAITPAFQMTAQTHDIEPRTYYSGITPVPVAKDLCINVSAGVAVQAIVYYSQF